MDLRDKKVRREIGRNCTCFNLRRAARLVTQSFDKTLRSAGITANQFSILVAVIDLDIPLTKLARVLGMERTTLTRNLNVLEKAGVIVVGAGDDRRERQISVTREGERLLETALPLWQRSQSDMIELLGQETWEGLISGLHAVARKM
ncbi:MAG: winged helix-turn-helix transcriptional regulator [Deltaproteobacteria bacterium]|nr:winged helix-turn-helix transcriptional regulator [Deltaproteobacteria bacterium]